MRPQRNQKSSPLATLYNGSEPTSFSDYPTAAYSAQYVARLHQGGSAEFTVSASEVSDGYLFTINSATSASITAGLYHWQLEITQNIEQQPNRYSFR